MTKRITIGALPSEIDALVSLPQLRPYDLKFLTARGTVEDRWVSSFLPEAQIVRYQLPPKKTSVEQADLTDLFRQWQKERSLKNISHLWLATANHDRPTLQRWSRALNVKLIATDLRLQQRFEQKIWFDRYLARHKVPRPPSRVMAASELGRQLPYRATVIQQPLSDGGEGTFFVTSTTAVRSLLRSGQLQPNERCLAREYIVGKSYGITVLIGAGIIALSGLRLQGFVDGEQHRRRFMGIQWLPTVVFKKNKAAITEIFTKLALQMKADGFLGFANFDFLLDGRGGIYLLECNPRSSFAQTHFSLSTDLLSGLNSNQLLFSALLNPGSARPTQTRGLSSSSFRGAALYLKAKPRSGSTLTVRRTLPLGVYRLRAGAVSYVTPDVRRGLKSNEFIFVSVAELGERYPAWYDIGTIISAFPLFNQAGRPNRDARTLAAHFRLG